MVAEVLINRNHPKFQQIFEYLVPEELQDKAVFGLRAVVPFGTDTEMGYLIGLKDKSQYPQEKLKAICHIMDETPIVTREVLALAKLMAKAYGVSEVSAMKTILPACMSIRKKTEFLLFGDGNEDIRAFLGERKKRNKTILQKTFGKKRIDTLFHEGLLQERITFNPVQTEKTVLGYALTGKVLHSEQETEQEIIDFLQYQEEATFQELQELFYVTRYRVNKMVEREILKKTEIAENREPKLYQNFINERELTLTEDQERVLSAIEKSFKEEPKKPFLLQGVTGSGKTLVYERLIEKTLEEGKSAILLVPEISLIPQVYGRFVGLFQEEVSVMHSGLSDGEKFDQFQLIAKGEKRIVVGARSAVFAPVKNLGLIIIDEEQEDSFKEDVRHPRYHAREVAQLRCMAEGASLLLGSATPSLDSYVKAAKRGLFGYAVLPKRINNTLPPKIQLIDMREEFRGREETVISRPLEKALKENLEKGLKSILLLNRRGYFTFVLCRDCGEVVTCPHCDVPLRYHKGIDRLICHYCGHTSFLPKKCPSCGSDRIKPYGVGTERVEEMVKAILPEAVIVRMDKDTTSSKNAHQKLLKAFMEEGDILIGTQMIAKGLDIEKVALVGILSVDSTLHLQHYKAAEKTFQLISQVAGRAGRGRYQGEVMLQTYDTEHYAILTAMENSYEDFAKAELSYRKAFRYPPYVNLYTIVISGVREERVKLDSERIKKKMEQVFQGEEILGPAPMEILKVKDIYRYRITLKSKNKHSDVMRKMERISEGLLSRENLISLDRT